MTATDVLDFIRNASGIEYMAEYSLQYARKMLRSWGFTRKVPVRRHVGRASRQKIAWFRKKIRNLIESKRREGYTICVQDESIVTAEARLRKGVYTPRGVRAACTYTGTHSKTVVFGLITSDWKNLFARYDRFRKEEFVDFLRRAHEKFGRILMILDGAPQHRANDVKAEVEKLNGLELVFLPPGCPDLSAIEEVWRQMKHAVLDSRYVTSGGICRDVDNWPGSSVPKLDIEKYLHRKA